MRRINVNMFPKDGHRFKEADGTVIGGPNWRAVINKVTAYRKRAGLPPGDPESEIHEQACQRNPQLCHPVSEVTQQARKEVSLKGRVLKWFRDIRRNPNNEPIRFVDKETARARAQVCAQCPMNTGLPEGCSSCKVALVELRKDLLGEGKPVDSRLTHMGCVVLGFEPATAVWIDQETIPNNELPAHCWRKKSI